MFNIIPMHSEVAVLMHIRMNLTFFGHDRWQNKKIFIKFWLQVGAYQVL